MGAKRLFWQTDGFNQIVQTLELERGELQVATHNINHLLVLCAVGVGVLHKCCIRDVVRALHIAYHAASVQVVCAARRREVQEAAGEDKWWAGDAHMYLLYALVQKLYYVILELCTSDNTIIEEYNLLVVSELAVWQ